MTRLSVIVPGFNTPNEWWRRCLNSVLGACGENDEVICVDDGSKERPVVDIADSRLKRIFLETNVGQAEARNRALQIATGEFVAFADSDDEVKNDIYTTCISELEKTGADVCMFGVECIWPGEGLRKHDVPNRCDVCEPSGRLVERWYKECVLNYVSNKVVRRSFLNSHKIQFDAGGMPCEDVIFYLETLTAGAKWCAIPVEGYVYYKSQMTSLSRYKACYMHGITKCADAWKSFCKTRSDGVKECGYHADLTERQSSLLEWDNIWRPGSPYRLVNKFGWLKQHRKALGIHCAALAFLRKLAFSIARRWCYFKPVRQWHYKRIYAGMEPWPAH